MPMVAEQRFPNQPCSPASLPGHIHNTAQNLRTKLQSDAIPPTPAVGVGVFSDVRVTWVGPSSCISGSVIHLPCFLGAWTPRPPLAPQQALPSVAATEGEVSNGNPEHFTKSLSSGHRSNYPMA